MFEKLTALIPDMPKLGRVVDIPVYMIHTTSDAEDYFFLFDFERFAEASTAGTFVKPGLTVFAGRNDFSRSVFARHFRETFQTEFDRMRADLGKSKNRGWLSWQVGAGIGGFVSGIVADLVLAIALSAGRAALGRISVPGWIKGKSRETALNDEIAGLKTQVDTALAEWDISLHPELYERARALGGPVSRVGMADEAWPLPDYVRAHLEDGGSGSWW